MLKATVVSIHIIGEGDNTEEFQNADVHLKVSLDPETQSDDRRIVTVSGDLVVNVGISSGQSSDEIAQAALSVIR